MMKFIDYVKGRVLLGKFSGGAGDETKFLRGDGTFHAIEGGGDMLAANNLGDVDDVEAAQKNLDVLSRSETLAHTNPRALAPTLHCDGATSGARAVVPLGSHAANMTAYTLPFKFTMPTSNPSSARGLGGLSASATAIGAGGIGLRLATNGDLQVRFHGATTSDYIQRVVPGAVAAYAGQPIKANLVIDSSGPTLYFNREDAGLTSETTAGTPPAWTDSPAADYFLLGVFAATERWQGRLSSYGPLNYAKTAQEIADLMRQGPTYADLAGGSQTYNVSGWGLLHPERGTIASASAGGFSGSTNNNTTPAWISSAPFPIIAGRAYVIDFEFSKTGGASSASVLGVRLNDNFGLSTGAYSTNHGFTANTFREGHNRIVLVATATAADATVCFLGNSATDIQFVISNFRLGIGLIANPQITRTAQLRDAGPNKLHGSITSGVTPMGGQMQPITFSQSATGYILGDNPLIFDPHFIYELWVKPTTSTIPNITFKRGGASGTEVVAAESAGTEGVWKKLTVIASAAEGAALDKYHVTFSTSAACDFRLIAQPL